MNNQSITVEEISQQEGLRIRNVEIGECLKESTPCTDQEWSKKGKRNSIPVFMNPQSVCRLSLEHQQKTKLVEESEIQPQDGKEEPSETDHSQRRQKKMRLPFLIYVKQKWRDLTPPTSPLAKPREEATQRLGNQGWHEKGTQSINVSNARRKDILHKNTSILFLVPVRGEIT